jgi:hypothetical protein
MHFSYQPEEMPLGYAFCREVWMHESGEISGQLSHNAATVFRYGAIDLDLIIDLIYRIDSGREIKNGCQVGVGLVRGLEFPLGFSTFPQVSMFSPKVMKAIVDNDEGLLARYGKEFIHASQAANLSNKGLDPRDFDAIHFAMDLLEKSSGTVINRFSVESGSQLL